MGIRAPEAGYKKIFPAFYYRRAILSLHCNRVRCNFLFAFGLHRIKLKFNDRGRRRSGWEGAGNGAGVSGCRMGQRFAAEHLRFGFVVQIKMKSRTKEHASRTRVRESKPQRWWKRISGQFVT